MSDLGEEAIGNVVTRAGTWNPTHDAPNKYIRYVDLSSVDSVTKSITDSHRLLGKDAPSRARQLVKTNDILVATVRPNLNGVAMVPAEFDGVTVSTGFCVLRPNLDRIYPRYLFQWAKSRSFVEDMVRKATGASYPAVSEKIVFDSKIPLPHVSEQQRIAEILDATDVLYAKRQATLVKLDNIAQSVFIQMFGDPNLNPKSISKKKLGDLIHVKSGNALVAADMAESGTHPVYGGNGINGYHDRYMFEEPKVVIGRVGVYCGAVHVTHPHAWVTDNALYVEERSEELEQDYLACALHLANLNQYAGRAAQPLVSGSRIYPVEILVPPPKQQKLFGDRLRASVPVKTSLMTSASKIEALSLSLQQRAFQGEL
jgi:type I restriction enzyme, S subunit